MKSLYRNWFTAAVVALLTPTTAFAGPRDDILVIGDSMLEWQRVKGASIPQILAKKTNRRVENRAASGAKLYLSGAEGNPRSVIPAQYTKGDWNWVVINGGANDLLAKCGCNRCDAVLDRLITKDGTGGVLSDLVMRIRYDGPEVILISYYEGNRSPNLFSRCESAVRELSSRQRTLAAQMDGVDVVRSKYAIDPTNRTHFALDGIHLSRKGTRRVGALLAHSIEKLEAGRN